jgi:hypothetical protein
MCNGANRIEVYLSLGQKVQVFPGRYMTGVGTGVSFIRGPRVSGL